MTELPDTSGVSDKEHVDLGEGLDTTMSALCSRMTELGHAMDHLPEVDPEGLSSDPDAETGYARKENAAKYVELRLNDLRPAAGALQREIKRKRKQLDIVEGDRGQIHNADARERYDISAGALRHEIDSLQAKLEAVEELMREAEQALSEARQRKWPRGKPEERPRYPDPPVPLGRHHHWGPRLPQPDAGPAGPGPDLDTELGGVMPNGPFVL